eukprot:8958462-Pyramimonas_sp.AAC.1
MGIKTEWEEAEVHLLSLITRCCVAANTGVRATSRGDTISAGCPRISQAGSHDDAYVAASPTTANR